MRSIFGKILLWSLATFALSLIAFWMTSQALLRRAVPPHDFFRATLELQLDEVILDYEEGGPERLAAKLGRLDSAYHVRHHLTDNQGRDLVTGIDRSAIVENAKSSVERTPGAESVLAHVRGSRDGRYRFIVFVPKRFEPPSFLPYFASIVLVIVLLCYILAVHLGRPLRRLRAIVERFGHGDLTARAQSTRLDEIGQVSRAFDQMADRIETLLAAERRLLQDVSHELRSPLARLGFAVELARTSEDHASALDRIKKEGDRLSCLVDELLQLTTLEGDPQARGFEPLSLDDLLHGLVDDCEIEAKAKDARVFLHREATSALMTEGDPVLLHRAFENILRNAIRHTPEGTAIEVVLSSTGQSAIVAVRDYGPGVPDQFLSSIFEPFVRVEGDRSRSSGGVGLGLSIARRAIELHHGTVNARNASPGLLMTIELPSLDTVAA
jgi:two-component system sensor histidine kinase CpxA